MSLIGLMSLISPIHDAPRDFSRMLENVAARKINHGIGVYGMCMYRSAKTGKIYYFGDSKSGLMYVTRFFLGSLICCLASLDIKFDQVHSTHPDCANRSSPS